MGQMPIVTFAITTPGSDVRLLKNEVEDALINPLRRVPGVGSVMLSNAPDQIVRIDVHQDRLLAHGLTMSELAGLIQANNMNIPAGDLTVEDLRFSVRMTGEQKSIDALRNLPLMKSPIGNGMVLLRDLADIHLDLKDETELAYVNGNTTILGYIRKTSDANVLEVANSANAIFEQAKQRLPAGPKSKSWNLVPYSSKEPSIISPIHCSDWWCARLFDRIFVLEATRSHSHYCQCDSIVYHRDFFGGVCTRIHVELSDADRSFSVCWNGGGQRCGRAWRTSRERSMRAWIDFRRHTRVLQKWEGLSLLQRPQRWSSLHP